MTDFEQEPTASVADKITRADDHKRQPMTRDLVLSSLVIARALLAPVHTTHSQPVALVEEGRRNVVLGLPVLDDQAMLRVERIDRESRAHTPTVRIAKQPIEAMLSQSAFAEDSVTQVDDVFLILASVRHAAIIACLSTPYKLALREAKRKSNSPDVLRWARRSLPCADGPAMGERSGDDPVVRRDLAARRKNASCRGSQSRADA
jgi:hypothetical protein